MFTKSERIYNHYRDLICSGSLPPGSRLPPEPDLAREFTVGRVTIRSAFNRLAAEGLLCRAPGKGTFVNVKFFSRRILIISVLNIDFTSPSNYLVPAIEREATTLGYLTEICYVEQLRALGVKQSLAAIRAKKLYGIILAGTGSTDDDVETLVLQQSGLPVVYAHSYDDDSKKGFALLKTDLPGAWRLGLETLRDRGCRRIGLLGFRQFPVQTMERPELEKLIDEVDVQRDFPWIAFSRQFNEAEIHKAVDILFSGRHKPDALFCFSDFFAMCVYSKLRKMKIAIPGDIAVMGFGGYPGSIFFDPPLSTIDLGYADIGCNAVKMLIKAETWFGQTPPEETSPFQLVVRESIPGKIPNTREKTAGQKGRSRAPDVISV